MAGRHILPAPLRHNEFCHPCLSSGKSRRPMRWLIRLIIPAISIATIFWPDTGAMCRLDSIAITIPPNGLNVDICNGLAFEEFDQIVESCD